MTILLTLLLALQPAAVLETASEPRATSSEGQHQSQRGYGFFVFPPADADLRGTPHAPDTVPTARPVGGSLRATVAAARAVIPPSLDVRQGRTGIVSHMGAGFPADYLAIPIGPGHRVRVCGPKACLTLVSTDAGPNRQSLLAGRIADVSVELFRKLCCEPSRGLFRGSWRLFIALPETSTEAP